MLKVIKFFISKACHFVVVNIYLVLIILLSVPAFWRMFPNGIHSMQDFHLFRLHEFDQCIKRFEIPCRWSENAGLGYGEPLFNFYGQGAYWLGEALHLISFSYIDSIKLTFIFSLMASGIGMYFLSKTLWKNSLGALLSSVVYIYAPYRAVDVWVRGALPESLAFVLFPLIILAVEKKNLFYFALLNFLLIITHNLSFVMFMPFLIVWITYRKWWKGSLLGLITSILLSAFYILPVIFESKYVSLESTTIGYFDFRAHFVTLKQIFLDFSWGYGGSTWGNEDGLNLSVGIIQWLLSSLIFLYLLVKRKLKENFPFLILISLGFLYLLLTHNKTAFIWEVLPFLKYIQFPWRFLGIAVFCFSLSIGLIFNQIKNKVFISAICLLVFGYTLFTTNYFKPDIWYEVDDSYFLNGEEWDRQRTASIGDFWPKFGHEIPSMPSDGTHINYFPGWESSSPMVNGLILKEGSVFKNTPIRTIGNVISLLGLFLLIIWKAKQK